MTQDPARLRAAEIAEARGVFTRFETDYGWRASTPFAETLESVLSDQRASRSQNATVAITTPTTTASKGSWRRPLENHGRGPVVEVCVAGSSSRGGSEGHCDI